MTSTDSIHLVDVRYRLLYLLARKNHNMHHRTSTESIRRSRFDICFVSLGQKKSREFSHIDRFDSPGRGAISAFVSLGQKNHNMHHHASIPIRFASRFPISGCVYLGQKNHNMHHRTSIPIRFPSRCAISGCVYLGQKITTCIIAHRRIRFAWSRCDICLCIYWPKKSQDSPGRGATSAFVSLGQKNHSMHHRTSADSSRLVDVR